MGSLQYLYGTSYSRHDFNHRNPRNLQRNRGHALLANLKLQRQWAPERAQGPKIGPRPFLGPGGPGGPGKASIAFLRGVAFTTQSFRPIRGLATPFKPNSLFFQHLQTSQLVVGSFELC